VVRSMGHICKEQNPPKFLVIFLYIRIPERVEILLEQPQLLIFT